MLGGRPRPKKSANIPMGAADPQGAVITCEYSRTPPMNIPKKLVHINASEVILFWIWEQAKDPAISDRALKAKK